MYMTKKKDMSLAEIVHKHLKDSKAENVVMIDLSGHNSFCDVMFLASGNSNRQVKAIADNLEEACKDIGMTNISIEGTENCQWVLVDLGDVVVHIFQPEARQLYRLEELWDKTSSRGAKTVRQSRS